MGESKPTINISTIKKMIGIEYLKGFKISAYKGRGRG
jgi:hypothetical protein